MSEGGNSFFFVYKRSTTVCRNILLYVINNSFEKFSHVPRCHTHSVLVLTCSVAVLTEKAVSGYILYKTIGELIVSTANASTSPYASDIELFNQPGARSVRADTIYTNISYYIYLNSPYCFDWCELFHTYIFSIIFAKNYLST